MLNNPSPETGSTPADAGGATPQQTPFSPPAISLPKGGGAIRGIGEKFAANPVTGTGSMTVPIPTSPGRSGFGPQLSLSYNSGSGNGPFGFGWSLSLPSITRKTDKGLPKYQDAEESDVFILSGAEDLVPVYKQDEEGNCVRDAQGEYVLDETERDGFLVRRYRPRVEGLFARIERWRNRQTGEMHWRSISKDNITTIYGKTDNSRIFDPNDPHYESNNKQKPPTRIFSWLICQSYDEKGNAIAYKYIEENSDRIFEDAQSNQVTLAHERNRSEVDRSANRYLKRINYGNRTPNRHPETWQATDPAQLPEDTWMFEVVFDYGERHYAEEAPDAQGRVFAQAQSESPEDSHWPARLDPFSSYRAGFEVRTYRLCQRVLMFHHIPDISADEKGYDGLVRSTDFTYSYERHPEDARNPIFSFLLSVTQSGYRRQDGGYLKRSLPPIEFEYSPAAIQDTVEEVDADSLENLPAGVDAVHQWTDLHGEGIPGILTEQGGAWFYKRNLSPINEQMVEFAPLERVATQPNLALAGGQAQFMDLAGDGQPDLVVLDGPMPGLYEHDGDEGWHPFRPFTSRLNRDTRDPNLKFVDLDGNGHADVLLSEDDVFVWHASMAEDGFGPAHRVDQALDEEKGPRLVFADGTESIYLADLSGDGLTDLARIRNGEVCYWPNLGYGRFGAKITMDRAPRFDSPGQFDQKRIRLADIDGSGTTDIIYLHGDGVRLYFNQSGNGWSEPRPLRVFPHVDDLVTIAATDLLGNGTACLVWSSPLPGDGRRPMRYVNLMGGQKPHLLVKSVNNLGAETQVQYAPSTKFYLRDKREGKPWITRLPFPVHVVERVVTYDHVSRNRFVTRYSYHHGHFDGEEREFRGFGLVKQWDTEEFATLEADGMLAGTENLGKDSHVPPVLTKTWFHTGVYLGRDRVSNYFAGLLDAQDRGEYYREPAGQDDDDEARKHLLDDTALPSGLTFHEEREACRALKGSMLRQEVYALDGSDKEPLPYTVTEQNHAVRTLQRRGGSRHAVFFTHAQETINYHYERHAADPRVAHSMTLEVDDYGNVLKQASIGYGRRPTIKVMNDRGELEEMPNPGLDDMAIEDQGRQTAVLITYTENAVTKAVEATDTYRTPLPCETRTYELTGYEPTGRGGRFQFSDLVRPDPADLSGHRQIHLCDGEVDYADRPLGPRQRRLIEHLRTLYRPDDLGVSRGDDPLALLPLGTSEALALPGEAYKLAFTPGLLDRVYQRDAESLLPDSERLTVLCDEGGYVRGRDHKADGLFPPTDPDDNWWIPSGRVYYNPDPNAAAADERVKARIHFFLPRRYRDPFHTEQHHTETLVDYDGHDLLIRETRDALGNRVTAGSRKDDGSLEQLGLDYRVLQPRLVMDPNRNRTEVVFDALGLVAGTAVMGKPEDDRQQGDRLDVSFEADLTEADIDAFHRVNDPYLLAVSHLKTATTRIIYDVCRFYRTRTAHPEEPEKWEPAFAATLARETHVSDPVPEGGLQIQVGYSYSDGFGREIQKKIQAEPGPVPRRDASGKIITGLDGQPKMTRDDQDPRWVGSGWTVFNNKGKPVRQFEPFFTGRHSFEFDARIGVSPILSYDPLSRLIRTDNPNDTFSKVEFDPWQQITFDENDTVLESIWYAERGSPDPYADLAPGDPQRRAAYLAGQHADTPAVQHLDTLGRPFMSVARNREIIRNDLGQIIETREYDIPTRTWLDIEGNPLAITDARENRVMEYLLRQLVDGVEVLTPGYDVTGRQLYQNSVDAGERRTLNDVADHPIRAWDSRRFLRRMTYDALRRPTGLYVTENGAERLAEQNIYGEGEGDGANHRTRLYQVRDGAGVVTNVAYDFKGNLLHSKRQLVESVVDSRGEWIPAYKTAVDWSDPNSYQLSGERFDNSTAYDALNRPVTLTTPDKSVTRPTYNEADLLEKVHVNLRGAGESTCFVKDIDYNPKGQRESIEYHILDRRGAPSVVRTEYEYDPLTFRLMHLTTKRSTDGRLLQDLRYAYDPVGSITGIRDDAQQNVFFDNEVVRPHANYVYDALYRLIWAEGREHAGQSGCAQPTHADVPPMPLPHPNDPQAMRRYTEEYDYDEVGNILRMVHLCKDSARQWTRRYDCAPDSNRLLSTSLPGDPDEGPYSATYGYDAHGNMTCMPHLTEMKWNFKDQLQAVTRAAGGTVYYVYNAAGQRVRKVYEHNGSTVEERIYLGGYEIYRKSNDTGLKLERETLHVMDSPSRAERGSQQRIALVETKTADSGLLWRLRSLIGFPEPLIRYQLGNHLDSASLELDRDGALISYEEYHPYGTTAFQAGRSAAEVSLKRYRYTGKERDEESGLYHHGARYYAPWPGRWISCDPSGEKEGMNPYRFVDNNPPNFVDAAGLKKEKSINHQIELSLPEASELDYVLGPGGVGVDFGFANRGGGYTPQDVLNLPSIELNNPIELFLPDANEGGRYAPETEQGTSTPLSGDYRFQILVGGPYTRGGEEHRYGHVALRVVTPTSDTVYDYGRYGRTWGSFGSQGEGILNVWSNFQAYVRGENALGRTTTGFSFNVSQQQAESIQSQFSSLTAGRTPRLTRGSMQRYRIASDYDALSCNCTTITLDPIEMVFPGFQSGAASFVKGRGMSWIERQGAKARGWPQHLFMPMDLKSYLESNAFRDRLSTRGLSPPTVNTYRQRQRQ